MLPPMTFARTGAAARAALRTGALAVVGVVALAACSAAGGTTGRASGSPLQVVAAENVWGSIAAQLGGSNVEVTNLIDSPASDPHDYEPTAADARAVASADYVVVNGVGYDTWASRLVAANPSSTRRDLTIGAYLGVPSGGNPHRWYSPHDVRAVIDRITADYTALDPLHAADYAARRAAFLTVGLRAYDRAIASINTEFTGTKVGASESIFALMAPALGLNLITPQTFRRAISEGNDPTASDKATVDGQIRNGEIAAYVYNSQNATPDVQAQVAAARANNIPVSAITETLTPAGASFQAWQTAQLVALRAALRGTSTSGATP